MLAKLRSFRPSHTTIVSYLALFIALGGSSYAAVTLKKNSVRSTHIKNGQVMRPDLRANAVTSPKVANGSLLSEDFGSGQLPAGPRGEQGPQGPEGPQGPKGSARAWGHVLSTGVLAQGEGVKSVTRRSGGTYCIDVDDNINPDTTTAIATPDVASSTSAEHTVHVEASRGQVGAECLAGGGSVPGTDFVVVTYLLENDPTDDDDGGGNTAGDNLSRQNKEFSFIVP